MIGAADPYWLLGALVQSGAALVAIVGGLMAASFVGAHERLSLAEFDLVQATERKESALARLSTANTRQATAIARRLLVGGRLYEAWSSAAADPALLNSEIARYERSEPRLAARIQHLLGAMGRHDEIATRLIRSLAGEATGSLSQLHSQLNVPARAAQVFNLRLRDELRAGRLSALSETLLPEVEGAISAHREALAGRIVKRQAGRRDAVVELRLARIEEARAQKVLESAREERFYGLGIEVLGAVASLTMVPSMSLMALGLADYPQWLLAALALLFMAGLVALGRFLYVYSRYLKGRVSRIPDHVWGLASLRRGVSGPATELS